MDSVGNIGSRRRAATGNHYSAEEQALDQIAKEVGFSLHFRLVSEQDCFIPFYFRLLPQAESRLAARRQARAEAREIRMRELEKQQKEMEENADRQFAAETGKIMESTKY